MLFQIYAFELFSEGRRILTIGIADAFSERTQSDGARSTDLARAILWITIDLADLKVFGRTTEARRHQVVFEVIELNQGVPFALSLPKRLLSAQDILKILVFIELGFVISVGDLDWLERYGLVSRAVIGSLLSPTLSFIITGADPLAIDRGINELLETAFILQPISGFPSVRSWSTRLIELCRFHLFEQTITILISDLLLVNEESFI